MNTANMPLFLSLERREFRFNYAKGPFKLNLIRCSKFKQDVIDNDQKNS